jgi:FkbM family methyltransferase
MTRKWELKLRDEFVDDLKPTTHGWLWPASDNGLWDGPSENWRSFKPIIKKHCRNFNTVVQAGGACGMYPYLLAQMFEVVYTFEPDPLNFYCLTHNTPLENVIKSNGALGQCHEMVQVNILDSNNVGCHTVTSTKQGIVPTYMVDDLDLSSCDFIMLDTEGYEYNVLLGAMQTIEKFQPLISLELGQTDAIKQLMESLSYDIIATAHADTYWAPKRT